MTIHAVVGVIKMGATELTSDNGRTVAVVFEKPVRRDVENDVIYLHMCLFPIIRS